jgi:thioredoxin-related protein
MFKKNILNFVVAALLLLVAAIYFSKEQFNHSGPQQSIWDNVQVDNRPVNPNPPVITPPDNGPLAITTYEEALAEAKRSDRKVLIVFGADWCTWCRKLEGTIKSQEVKKAIADGNIIHIHVDTDKRKELARKYSVRGIPAYVLIDKDENTIRSGSGFKDPANFVNWMLGRWGTNQGFLSWLFGR